MVERATVEPNWKDSGLVFTARIGTVIETPSLGRLLNGLIIQAVGELLEARLRATISRLSSPPPDADQVRPR